MSAQSMTFARAPQWNHAKRNYTLLPAKGSRCESVIQALMVERFAFSDSVSEGFVVEIHALSLNAKLPVEQLLGQSVQLVTQSDGAGMTRSALITDAWAEGSDGGFASYVLILEPWAAQMQRQRRSRIWQDKTLLEILDEVFTAYRPWAEWQWGERFPQGGKEDIHAFVDQGAYAGTRPFVAQFRETDWEFAQRLLADLGLGWRVEDCAQSGCGHQVVIFVESCHFPENSRSAKLGSINWRRDNSHDELDCIQSLAAIRQLQPLGSALLAWNGLAKTAVAAQVPTSQKYGSESLRAAMGRDTLPWLSEYQPAAPGCEEDTVSGGALKHQATLRQESHEARAKIWVARSSVSTLCAGQHFVLGSPERAGLRANPNDPESHHFSVLSVLSVGVNNLPSDEGSGHARPFGHARLRGLNEDTELLGLAKACGHANRLEAIRRSVPWRPAPRIAPLVHGTQTAVVVGPSGEVVAQAGREVYTDEHGRVRLRFYWQGDGNAASGKEHTCWVRMTRRMAGAGMGWQPHPRIGDEVVVAFLGGVVARPVIVGSVYSGRGEASVVPTPGGAAATSDTQALSQSTDHRAAAQGNLVEGGRSPAWHGMGAQPAQPDSEGQNNAGALGGFKAKEWGDFGFSQLVWDDTPRQLRTQMATTLHGTQLNMGHLIHQADNHRGSFRGVGAEVRTDAFGALRGKQGVLLSTFPATWVLGIPQSPAMDNVPGNALIKQAFEQAKTFDEAAKKHRVGAWGSQNQKVASPKDGPISVLKSLDVALSGMGNAFDFNRALDDCAVQSTRVDDGLPQTAAAVVAMSGRQGLATLTSTSLQWSGHATINHQAGSDLRWISGGQMRWHATFGMGVLAGTTGPGIALSLTNGKGPIQMTAMTGQARLASKRALRLQSLAKGVDWTAAQKIVVSNAAGTQIVIDAQGIVHRCVGKITFYAGSRSFVGPEKLADPAPPEPVVCADCMEKAKQRASALAARV